MTMGKTTDTPQAVPNHGRTPDNTPLPGGGRWSWDDIAGAWRSLDVPADAATPNPAQE